MQIVKPSCRIFPDPSPYPINSKHREIIIESRKYIHSCHLIYTDTDSFLYFFVYTEEAKYMTHEQLYAKTFLSVYLDRSNFKQLSRQSYCSPGDHGFFKSEVNDAIIHELVALSPKCYSILSFERGESIKHVKSAIKGCPTRTAAKVYNHQTFLKMLFEDDFHPPLARSNLIRRDPIAGVNTVHDVKSCLSLLDNKRSWKDKFTSLAYHHPDIIGQRYTLGDVTAARGAVIANTIPDDNIIFSGSDWGRSDYYNDHPDFFEDGSDDGVDGFDNSEDINTVAEPPNSLDPLIVDQSFNFDVDVENVIYYMNSPSQTSPNENDPLQPSNIKSNSNHSNYTHTFDQLFP